MHVRTLRAALGRAFGERRSPPGRCRGCADRASPTAAADRARLGWRAQLLAGASVAHDTLEALIAVAAGPVAVSVALVGFGMTWYRALEGRQLLQRGPLHLGRVLIHEHEGGCPAQVRTGQFRERRVDVGVATTGPHLEVPTWVVGTQFRLKPGGARGHLEKHDLGERGVRVQGHFRRPADGLVGRAVPVSALAREWVEVDARTACLVLARRREGGQVVVQHLEFLLCPVAPVTRLGATSPPQWEVEDATDDSHQGT